MRSKGLARAALAMSLLLLELLPASMAAGAATGVDEPLPYSLYGTHIEKFRSKKAGIDYLLYVSLPRDYEKHSESYPVVFVLDADYCFPLVQTIARFLADRDELRPLIVVGIAYPGVAQEKYGPIFKQNRTRDYTPTHVSKGGYGVEFQKQSGGADHFLDFVERELVPYLDHRLRVKQDRTIIGYSYGGLLATYAQLTRPALFQRSVIVSPSLWYDDHTIMSVLQRTIASHRELHGRAFYTVGGLENGTHGERGMVSDLQSFVRKLAACKYSDFSFKLWIPPGETHHTIYPGAVMRGIRWVYSNADHKK